jgi:hypothetical protein
MDPNSDPDPAIFVDLQDANRKPVLRIRDVYPGSRIRIVSIPDPGSSSKNLSILTPKKAKKWFLSSKKYDPGCSSRIPMLTFSHPGSRIQGPKGTQSRIPNPDPQHCRKLYYFSFFCFLHSEGTFFTSFFKDKKSKEVTKQ